MIAIEHPNFVEFVEKLAKWREMKLCQSVYAYPDFRERRESIMLLFEQRQERAERIVQRCLDAGSPVPSASELLVWHSLRKG